ncbi:hypothetical protein QBC43DRAFT_318817 [Cladorrhinum sp. PSN259]|nr:hypothetical protein QBC43DRAFT_318817 [Cladorrhinum sp. PSN259]
MPETQTPLPNDVESRFRRVLQKFKDEDLKGLEPEQFPFTDLADLRSSIKEIQDKQAAKARMRNINRLKKFLEGMEQYEKLIEVFLNASEFVAFVWGPMKFLLLATNNYVRAFDALLEHYEDMGEQLEVLAHHHSLFESRENGHLNIILEMIFRDVLDFHAKALSYFRQKRWRTIFDVTWNSFRTRFSEPINNLKRHCKLLESYTNLTTLERITALSNDQTEALKLQRDEARRRQYDRVRSWLSPEDMLADQEHYAKLRGEYPGTGDWILRRNLVMAWLDPDIKVNPILWVTGIPGAGKTVLASVIIEAAAKLSTAKVAFVYCRDGNRNRNNFLSIAKNILYQLSKNDDQITEYIDAIMSKEGQTTLQRSELAKDLLRVIVRSHDNVYIVIDGLDECLKQERKSIFSWIQSVVSSDREPWFGQRDTTDQADDVESTLIRCLLVSQEDSESSRLLKGYPVLKILPSDNYGDVKTYCEAWESKIRSKHPMVKFDGGANCITSNVLRRADGMFQFARLVMVHLYDQRKAFRLHEELKWLSEDNEKQGVVGKLDEAYGRILRSMRHDMDDEKYRDAMQVLSWVAVAQRDLGWHEIQGAASLDVENQMIDFEGRRFSDKDGPKDLCGSLLEVTPGGVVTLVHSTARAFLTKQHVNVTAEHLNFTIMCLSYLSVNHVNVLLSDEVVEDNIMKGCYAFFDYAASHWLDHLTILVTKPATLDASSMDHLSRVIRHFLRQHFQKVVPDSIPPRFAKEFDLRSLFGPEDFLDALSQAAYMWSLHFASSSKRKEEAGDKDDQQLSSRLGLERFIPRLRSSLDKVAQRLKDSTGLLQLQQYHGPGLFKCRFIHCDYFHTGFPNKAARDSHQNKHDCSFFCAFDGCWYGITGFASSKSLEAHIRNAHAASNTNHSYKSQFPVLDNPRDIDVRAAIRDGSLSAVQRWAEWFNGPIPLKFLGTSKNPTTGIDTRFIRTSWSSLLFVDVLDYSRLDILKYLVENSEDVELTKIAFLRCSFGRSRWPDAEEWIFSMPSTLVNLAALHYTVAYNLPSGDEALCLRTLKHYRQSSVDPTRKFSLLHLMARRGFLTCVRFLVLDCGLDANHIHSKRTVLMEAAEGGRDSIVRFLTEEQHCTQATVDYDSGKGTAAAMAAANGHETVLRILAASTTPDRFQTLLSLVHLRQAAIVGDNEVVLGALNAGIPIDVPDSDWYTPFLHSVENNNKETVKLLLNRAREQISINRRCLCHHHWITSSKIYSLELGATALIIACMNGNEDIVKLLLECDDIDTNAKFYTDSRYFKNRNFPDFSMKVDSLWLVDTLGFQKIKMLLEEHENSRQPPSPHTTEDANREPGKILHGKDGSSDLASQESSGEEEIDSSA